MLDFVADNYLWFIVLGVVLLVIALILLFSRKKPIKEEVAAVQPMNTDVNNNDNVEPEIIEVTGDTEILDIVDNVVEQGASAAAFAFEPVVSPEEKTEEVVENVDPFAFEPEVTETVSQEKDPLFEETVVVPVVEPVLDNNVVESAQEPAFVENNVEPVFEQPITIDEPVAVEEVLPKQNFDENPINVGDVVMPQENVNTDNVPVNNELDEDIWKF